MPVSGMGEFHSLPQTINSHLHLTGALKGCWKVLPPPCLPQMRQKTVEFRGGERLPPKFLPLAFGGI